MVDYSKFDNIDDSDDDITNNKDEKNVGTAEASKPPAIGCKNCLKSCGKPLMCGKCRAVTYCSAACQKEDWQFHKRTCNKPVPMEEALHQKFPGAAVFGGSGSSEQSQKDSSKSHPKLAVPSVTPHCYHDEVSNDKLDDDEEEELLQDSDEQSDERLEDEHAAIAEVVEKMVPAVWKSVAPIALNQCDVTEIIDAPIGSQTVTSDKKERNDGVTEAGDAHNDSIGSSEQKEASHVLNKVDAPRPQCMSCLQVCTKPLTCGVCKRAIYCSSKCQKEDWQFHRRSCKKAKPPVTCQCGALFKDDHMFCYTCGARRLEEKTMGQPLRLNPGETEHVRDEDVEDWYRHREWMPEDKREFPPTPLGIAEASIEIGDQRTGSTSQCFVSNDTDASEAVNMLPWWEEQLASLDLGLRDGAVVLKVDRICDVVGTATMAHDNGVTRSLFDLEFVVEFEVEKEETTAAGYMMQTTSNGQVRISGFSNERRDNFHLEIEGPSVAVDAESKLVPQLRKALIHLIDEYEKKA